MKPGANILVEWDEYERSLDRLVTLDEVWHERLKLAFEYALNRGYNKGHEDGIDAGVERGYERGYEDGRKLEWGKIQAIDAKKGK